MNKIILIGNLTRDPELSTTNSGVSLCRFGLAVQRPFSNNGNDNSGVTADFFNITVWRNQAENCHKFLKKGSKCCVVGRVQMSTYEASDGTKRSSLEVTATDVEFLNSRSADGEPSSKPAGQGTSELEPIDDDSLPF
jgi:single-strand DNA-binding protein